MTASRIEAIRARLREARAELDSAGGVRIWLFHFPGPGTQLMSWLRKRATKLRNPHAEISFGDRVYLGPGFGIDAPRGGTFIVGSDCEFRRGFRAELSGPTAWVEIGARTIFTHDALIQCASTVSIGSDCQVDQAVLLVDGNHRVRSVGIAGGPDQLRPLTIGDHVTITTKCTVIAPIGSHSMVGANSVVLRPLPSHSLAAGSPAQVIGYFGPEAK